MPDQTFVVGVHDFVLQHHHKLGAAGFFVVVDLIVEFGGNRAFLRREGEHAGAFDARLAQVGAEVFKIVDRFAGESDDQARAQHKSRQLFAQLRQKFGRVFAGVVAVHRRKDRRFNVLDGDIEVAEDLFVGGDRFDQLVGNAVRVRVVQAHPADGFDRADLLQQFGEHRLAAKVNAVFGDVLRDDDELNRTFGRQMLAFGQNIFFLARAQRAADRGDRTVGTAVVAAFGDLDVGGVGRHTGDAADLGHGRVFFAEDQRLFAVHRRFQRGNDLRVRAATEHGVDLGHFGVELLAVALGETARDDDRLQTAFLFALDLAEL